MTRVALASGIVLALGLGVATAAPPEEPGTWEASGKSGAVAAGGSRAVDAGIEILKGGGNAADSAVATILALTVTDSKSCCFGGEVPIIVYDAKRKVVTVVAGQGAAPRLATLEHFKELGGIPGKGIEPAAVPAALDACLVTLEEFGTRTFAEVVAPTLRLLDEHAEAWHADLARTIRILVEAESRSQGDRRRGLRLVADAFYRGPIAREIDAWARDNGGLIRFSDLATHVTRVEEPLALGYRGHTILKCGAWTQGPCLLEALQLLEGFDLKSMGPERPESVHLSVEALKLALADRDTYYADPLFEDVPVAELLAPRYAAARRALIDLSHASLELRPGDPRAGKALRTDVASRQGTAGPANDTTTCVVADRFGNVVAATPSGWSGVVAGKTGVWLGTRLQSFNIWPGHPDCIAPGKRPRITLTPTLVMKEGKPVYALSVAGGDNQDQMMLQLVTSLIDFGRTPAEAVTAPRFLTGHYIGSFRQTPPSLGELKITDDYPAATLAALKALGHKVIASQPPLAAAPVAIGIDPSTGLIRAAGDPKTRRHAAAY